VILDCPSSLGRLTEAALWAAHEIFIPVRCEYFAMEGMPQLIQLVKSVMHAGRTELQFGGIVLTMHEDSLETTREVDKKVRDFFGGITMETVIPRDGAVPAAHRERQSVMEFDPGARSARAFVELCMEVLERE
jgi:chromosome partitioning protein